MTTNRRIGLAVAIAIASATILVAVESFIHTRFQSSYVPASAFSERNLFLLTGERERGHLVQVVGKGFHSAEPGRTEQDVLDMLRRRYPNDFDEKKVIWVLRDEEGAFFYRLLPNWPALGFLSALVAGAFFMLSGIKVRRKESPSEEVAP